MHQEAVVVKEEPGWSLPAGSCGVSEAAARAGLYTDHEVKDELVVGPERLQPRDAVYTLPACIKEESELVKVAEHPQEKTECMVDSMKEEPSCSENIAACGVSAAAARAGLYAGHAVKDELVLGPEHLQRPDVPNLPYAGESVGVGRASCPTPSLGSAGQQLKLKECVVRLERMDVEMCLRTDMSWSTEQDNRHGVTVEPVDHPLSSIVCMSGVAARNSPRPAPSPSTHTARTHTTPAHNTTRGTVLSEHTPAHRKKGHTCRVCGKEFQFQSALKRHERVHTGERPYSCGICSKKFTQQGSLKIHERIHTGEKLYSCGVCSKEFTRRHDLEIHERIHTGEKRYSCGVCSKKFTQQGNLKMHERIHTREKLYSCGVCSKEFTRSHDLQIHERSHTEDKPYSCGVCSKEFKRQSSLKVHERIHTGEKRYSCGVCSKKFTQQSYLRIHERIHTGEKPYSCGVCSKKFTQQSHLKMHEKIHTGDKRYSCGVCSKKFAHQGYLKVHERIHAERENHNLAKYAKRSYKRFKET